MKCEMDENGKITISPTDGVESYALKAFVEKFSAGDILIETSTEPKLMGFKSGEPPV